jgi:hypothetical protein
MGDARFGPRRWNANRKREILQTAIAYAKSQHEATHHAVDAWSCLSDEYVGLAIIPMTQTRRAVPKQTFDIVNNEVQATIYGKTGDTGEQQTIIAIDQELLKNPSDSSTSATIELITAPDTERSLPLVVASPIPKEDKDTLGSWGQDNFGTSSISYS